MRIFLSIIFTCILLSGSVYGQKIGGPKQYLNDQIIDDIISIWTDSLQDKDYRIFNIPFNYVVSPADEARLLQIGLSPAQIIDIRAKGVFQHARQSMPLANSPVLPRGILSDIVLLDNSTNEDIAVYVWRVISGTDEINFVQFVNQTDQILNLISIQYFNLYNVSLKHLRSNWIPLPSELDRSNNYRITTRFGEILDGPNLQQVELLPHPDKADLSRFDIWEDENSFVGQSSYFTNRLGPPAASFTKKGLYYYHDVIQMPPPPDRLPGNMRFYVEYCWTLRDNDGNFSDDCHRVPYTGSEPSVSTTYGITFSSERYLNRNHRARADYSRVNNDFEEKYTERERWDGRFHSTSATIAQFVEYQGRRFFRIVFTDLDPLGFNIIIDLYNYTGEGTYDFGPSTDNRATFNFEEGYITRTQNENGISNELGEYNGGTLTIRFESESSIYGEFDLRGTSKLVIEAVEGEDESYSGIFKAYFKAELVTEDTIERAQQNQIVPRSRVRRQR